MNQNYANNLDFLLLQRHWQRNQGKCGICGDPWDVKPPRPHEDGGLYGTGTVVRTYKAGQTIEVVTNIVANHMGYMTYKICPFQVKNDVFKKE